MIGILRLFLALIVMAEHLGPEWWWELHFAHDAVRGFYLLSGYFATMQMVTRYQGQENTFLKARLIRILPSYWVVLALSLIAVAIWDLSAFHPMMIFPGPIELFRNFSLLVAYGGMASLPVVQAWALPVILFWNALIAWGLFKSRNQTFIVLALFWMSDRFLHFPYFSLIGGAVPFAIGGAMYWLRVRLPEDRSRFALWCRQMSYPVLLSHYIIGAIIWQFTGIERGWALFWLSLPIVLMVSVGLHGCEAKIKASRS
jgi:peptidoglycan/LPS O-acetylase OafA/YrhL